MELSTLTLILILHFIADFILQSDYVPQNKSKSNKVLLQHIVIYGLPFLLISPLYAIVNAILHGIVDYNTSRLSSKLWAKKEVHWFFVVIGADQLLHMLALIWTYKLMF